MTKRAAPVESVPAIPAPEPLTSVFFHRAEVDPEQVASYSKIEGRWTGTTWAQTRQAVEETSLGLLELGAQRGDRVAILSQTRREWMQSDMAIMAIGGVTIGIYPTLTIEQTRYLIEHAGCRIVFVEDRAQRIKVQEATASFAEPIHIVSFEERLGEGERGMTLEALRRTGAKRRKDNPEEIVRRARESKPSDIVTFVYTSGTTGEPKGAMLSHANFHYVIHATSMVIPYDGERGIAFLPLAHSLQRYVNYLGLIANVEAYYAESLEKVRENLREVRPTVFSAVPRILEKIHAAVMAQGREAGGWKSKIFGESLRALHATGSARRGGWQPGLGARIVSRVGDRLVAQRVRDRMGGRVKFIGCGSAPLAREVHEFFEDIGVPILEGWGLTETSAPVCLNTLGYRRIGTVGRPIPGTDVKIASDGELLVRGPGVFAGYYNNPSATAEAFDDEGWFKTGDIGEISRDGFVTITDRKKDLIITAGGKNVAPQPIENLLKRDPIIGQAVVVGDRRPYLTALLGIDAETRAVLASQHGLAPEVDAETLARVPAVRARLEAHVDSVNAGLATFERIKRWDVLPGEMTVDSGELTPTLKVKRRVVAERYADRIERLYTSSP